MWLSLLISVIAAGIASAGRPRVVSTSVLWREGDEGIPSYRIPIISYTPKGNLFVMIEGRRESSSDIGTKYHMMRRSTDKGQTWSPSKTILTDDAPDGMNFGVIVVDDEKSVMHMILVRCAHYYMCTTAETFQRTSYDDGITWSAPRSLNKFLGTKMFAPGPGTGFQKKYFPKKGRLITCGHSTINGDGMFMLISDDHGESWRYAGNIKSIPYEQPKKWNDFVPDECQPFELSDGSIVVNIRNQNNYHCNCRMIARSYDGGETFELEDLYFDEVLIDPVVCAGANINNDVWYFSNPYHRSSRQNLQLTWSKNQGKDWERDRLVIWSQRAGYSVIAVDPKDKKNIFMVYERGIQSDIQEMAFHRIDISSVRATDNFTLYHA